jgi:hypothetical protein
MVLWDSFGEMSVKCLCVEISLVQAIVECKGANPSLSALKFYTIANGSKYAQKN